MDQPRWITAIDRIAAGIGVHVGTVDIADGVGLEGVMNRLRNKCSRRTPEFGLKYIDKSLFFA
jgi:hypothetical protein